MKKNKAFNDVSDDSVAFHVYCIYKLINTQIVKNDYFLLIVNIFNKKRSIFDNRQWTEVSSDGTDRWAKGNQECK